MNDFSFRLFLRIYDSYHHSEKINLKYILYFFKWKIFTLWIINSLRIIYIYI